MIKYTNWVKLMLLLDFRPNVNVNSILEVPLREKDGYQMQFVGPQ